MDLDEDEIKLMLVDTPDQCTKAVDHVFLKYKRPILAYYHKRFPGLTVERAIDAMTDTFIDLFQVASERRFDIDQPLEAFLFHAAEKNGIDQLRKQLASKNSFTDYVDDIGECLRDTNTGNEWRRVIDKGHAEDIQREFRVFIGGLPPAQRQVAQVMADYFPNFPSTEEYIDEIHRRTGTRLTGVQIKGSLAEIRKKFGQIMKSMGL